MPELNQTTVLRETVLPRVNVDGSLVTSQEGVALKNDEDSPGANKVYGTDADGVKGWKDDSSGGDEEGLAAHIADTGNPHEVTSEQIGIGVNVDDYGAVGDGSTDDTDAIQDAVTDAGTNGVVRFTPGKTYIQKNKISTLLSNQTWIGYGATLKRCDAISTTLSATASSGATSITVASTTGFAVGDNFMITHAAATYGGRGYLENSWATTGTVMHTITAINGNVITFTGAISLPSSLSGSPFPIGSRVLKTFPQIEFGGGTGNKIIGLTIDGNKANNQYTSSWVANTGITRLDGGGVFNCKFQNMPCETMFVNTNTQVKDCFATDLNGSFWHESSPLTGANNIASGNTIKNAILEPFAVSGHNEGVFTCSANTQKALIANNTVITATYGAFFANMNAHSSDLDSEVFIHNNIAFSCLGVFDAVSSAALGYTISIQGNHFKDCEYLTIRSSTTIQAGLGTRSVRVIGNYFEDVRIFCSNVSNGIIADNEFYFNDETVGTSKISGAEFGNAISLLKCAGFKICNNHFEDRHATTDTNLQAAIGWGTEAITQYLFIKSDASTTTKYSYAARHITISDNTIIGFAIGITDDHQQNYLGTISYIGVSIDNNVIQLKDHSSAVYAIKVPSGVTADNNKCYGNSNSDYGIYVLGATSANSANFNGGICTNNKVYGFSVPIRVGDIGANYIYNSIVVGNIHTGTVNNNTSSNSTVSGNTALAVNEVPTIQLVRGNTAYY